MSDTHLPRGSRQLPEACVRLLTEAELIVHAGDLTTVAVLELLETLAPVVAVHGNVDEPALREQLPARAIAEAQGARIGVVHDAGRVQGRSERLVASFPDCDAVVYGHTHLPELGRAGRTWILNPGSPTERRRAPAHTMIVWRDGSPELISL